MTSVQLKSVFPEAHRPGDVLKTHVGECVTVQGTILERRTALSDHALFHTDVLLYSDAEASENPISLDDADGWKRLSGPPPAVGFAEYQVSPALQEALQQVIEAPGDGLAWRIMQNARELGYHVYVVGGAVRDFLSGAATGPDQVNDLDITGDMPSGLFGDLAKITALDQRDEAPTEGKRAQRRRVASIWIPHVTISASGVVHCYRLASRADRSKRPEQDHFLEYAPFKQGRCRIPRLGTSDEFVFGCDPREDSKWRDLSINSLLYDPFSNRIIDPAGGLRDFTGIQAAGISNWDPGTAVVTSVNLRPLDLPVKSTPFWTAKAVARLVKSVDKYPDATLSDALEWVRKSRKSIEEVPARGRTPGAESLEQHLRTQFKVSATNSGTAAARARILGALDRLAQAGAPDWFTQLIQEAAQGVGGIPRLGDGRGIWPVEAVNAYRLVRVDTQGGRAVFELEAPLPQPSDDPQSVFDHWRWTTSEYAIERVLVREAEDAGPASVYAFVSGGLLLVPTDGQGRLLSFNVEGDLFSRLRQGDLDSLLNLFPEVNDRPASQHRVTPDHEAPSQAEWPVGWPSRPSEIRSRPNPVEQPRLSEDMMTEQMKEMEALKRLRNAGLLEVSPPDHDLYWACMNNGSVQLTPLGRYYWDQVNRHSEDQS